MSLSPSLGEPEDRAAVDVDAKGVVWTQGTCAQRRRRRWKLPNGNGVTWIEQRSFGTVGFAERGPDGCALYVETAGPVFVTAGEKSFIAWPRKKNWITAARPLRPDEVATLQPGMPIFKTAMEAWTFFAEHFCGTWVALFEIQHGVHPAYAPVALLSSGMYAIRPQDRIPSFKEATERIFDTLSAVFVVTEPVAFLDAGGKETDVQRFKAREKWAKRENSLDQKSPFECDPLFYHWEDGMWKRSTTTLEIGHAATRIEGSVVRVSLTFCVPPKMTVRQVHMAVAETFYFNRKSPDAGIRGLTKAMITVGPGRTLGATFELDMERYAAAFESLNSNPWACVPVKLAFHNGHPDVLVLGLATPRYVRGDIRNGILHKGAPRATMAYYKIGHKKMRPGLVEVARFLDEEGTVNSVVQSKTHIVGAERLRPGEVHVLLKYLTSLKTWFRRRNKLFPVPLYTRTSIIYEANPGSLDIMSKEAKLDRCAVLQTPFWGS